MSALIRTNIPSYYSFPPDISPKHQWLLPTHLQARGMRELCLGALRMVMATVPDGTAGGPNRQLAAVKFVAGSVSVLGRLVDNLRCGWVEVVQVNTSDTSK